MEDRIAQAGQMDSADPLRRFRDEFLIPRNPDGTGQIYFAGNSLGLQPRRAERAIAQEMAAWARLGVEGFFVGDRRWLSMQDAVRAPLARLVGGLDSEVALMNTLTANLHFLMVSFYRPAGQRDRILIERQPFPSDRYAAHSQIRFHGLDPSDCLVELGAGEDNRLIDESLIEDYLRRQGERVALVLWPGLHYATGQRFDVGRITRAAHAAGALIGFDLAHAVGNVPLSLHGDGPDFAAWCNYKYLNGGPGAAGGCFVHERHHGRRDLPRFEGWWGNDPASRFRMHPEFQPAAGVDAWQLSTTPVLSLALIRSSLQLFEEAGMGALRRKSVALTAWLEELIRAETGDRLQLITPSDPRRRGCQLSIRVRAGRAQGRALFRHLVSQGVTVDWREPDVIRAAPVPLYNTFEECAAFIAHCHAFFQG